MNHKTGMPELRFPDFEGISSYKKHSFKDIFLFSTGKNIKQSEASPEFETLCVRYGELYHMYNEVIYEVINKTNLDISELVFSKGDEILLPSAGEDPLDIGSASALTIENIAIGRTINILRPIKENIYSQIYASYYINEKLRNKISKLAKGSSISNVYNSDLKTLEIILPALPEQQKTASFLSSIDEKIQQISRKKELLEQYKKGIMQQLFSGKLRFKDENGNDYADWEEKKLGEVGEIITGKTPSTTDLSLWNGNIHFVTPTDIDESKYQKRAIRSIKENKKIKLLPAKSLMFTCIASIGKMSLSMFPCITNQQINSIVPNENFDNEFIYYAVLNIVDYIKSTQSTTTLPIINKTEFSKFIIGVPASMKEQQKIAAFLANIDAKIESTNQQIKQMQNFKKGLLQQLFV
jgi:type I restriction enzyme S subunit